MFRVGTGFDIHRLEEGHELILGGVLIPSDKGCVAHSDGDALCHSIIDALLGAAGFEDIGVQFPNTDPEYKDFSSLVMLRMVNDLLRENDYEIVNIDSTVILQTPNLSEYKERMREQISEALDLDIWQVNVKAKTAEHLLEELGRGDAVEAQSVVMIQK